MRPLTLMRLAATLAVLTRLARGARRLPSLEPTPHDPATGTISVVIPARDEEHRLGPCLAGLAGDDTVSEIIVVDDNSTDATVAVAEAAGAGVVCGTPPTTGWAGKTWALQQGIEAAGGDWVVTLDADTRPRPGLVAAAVGAAQALGADLLTVGARFDCPSAGERMIHPAMLATLVYRFGPPDSRRPPRPGRVLVNGQCMVVARIAFLAGGGMKPVASSLTEDVALGRHLARNSGTVRFVDGASWLDVAGYGSAAAAWSGWGRSFSLSGVTTRAAQAVDVVTVWLTLAAPLPRLLFGRGDAVDRLLVLVRIGSLVATAKAYRRRGPAYWLSPLADPAVAWRLTTATLLPDRRWRNRSYETEQSPRRRIELWLTRLASRRVPPPPGSWRRRRPLRYEVMVTSSRVSGAAVVGERG